MNNKYQNLINEWKKAYELANNKEAPDVIFNNGWFDISGTKIRKNGLEQAIINLNNRASKNQQQDNVNIINNVFKEDILLILKDIVKNDVPAWELDDNYLKDGLTGEEQKEWAEQCLNKAIEFIEKNMK